MPKPIYKGDASRGKTPLSNAGHERFAHARAQGATLLESHRIAGYAPADSNASSIANRPDVADRIEFLRREYGDTLKHERIESLQKQVKEIMKSDEVIDRTVVQRELYKNLLMARSLGKIREANEAVRLLGETVGAFEPEPPKNVQDQATRLALNGATPAIPTIAGTLAEIEHSLGDFNPDPDAQPRGRDDSHPATDEYDGPSGDDDRDSGDTGED